MAMYGKALGNGYAITAVVGKRSIMENANTNFISSTCGQRESVHQQGLNV